MREAAIGKLGWLAVGMAIASIVSAIGLVLFHEVARPQLLSLQLPPYALGEAAVLMLLPLALSAMATGLALISCRRRSGRWGLALAALSWLVTFGVLGSAGLHTVF